MLVEISLCVSITDRGYLNCLEAMLSVAPVASLNDLVTNVSTSAIGSVRNELPHMKISMRN